MSGILVCCRVDESLGAKTEPRQNICGTVKETSQAQPAFELKTAQKGFNARQRRWFGEVQGENGRHGGG